MVNTLVTMILPCYMSSYLLCCTSKIYLYNHAHFLSSSHTYTIRNIDITSNTYSEILFHGTHRKLSESYKMSAVNPLTKPPLPRRTSTTSRPRVDDSYIVMNPVSVKKEISDGLYAEVGTEKETTYENMGECQVPSMPSEYIEPKSQHTPNNT